MLVFATLHTTNAANAISRIIDVSTARGAGHCAHAAGLPSLSYMIREGKPQSLIQTGCEAGMVTTMDQSLVTHNLNGRISLNECTTGPTRAMHP